jgi:hypothetical protein
VSQALVVRTWTHTWARLASGRHSLMCDVGKDPCTGSIRGGQPYVRAESGDGWVAYVCAPCARTSPRLRRVAS